MSELHTHCQCDNCTGEDCGQDNPEEYEREREEERADIRQAEREKVLDELEHGIDTYEKEHNHKQVVDDCLGIYIPINVVRRLIAVRRELRQGGKDGE